ncbi:MAG: HobA family DNA replication regulator [Campylobacteraceae bacterium]|jgi:hypothetical protein|nr:HobA family DNA replication regulator [Campylobacteraceae bacterium]
MQEEFQQWTLEAIRKEGTRLSWLEEKRSEWTPLLASTLKKLLNGYTFIIMNDSDYEWFAEYMLFSLNKPVKSRPFVPFVSVKSLFPNINALKSNEDFALFEDMLSLMFGGNYTFFYIGKSNDIKYQIAKRKYDSFLWIIGEQVQNSFYLELTDERLDIKLLELFKLLNRSIDAVLSAEVSLED